MRLGMRQHALESARDIAGCGPDPGQNVHACMAQMLEAWVTLLTTVVLFLGPVALPVLTVICLFAAA